MFEKILSAPKEVGRFGRFLFFQVKLWRYCLRLLRQNRCFQQAAALSYHTIFGIVPLAIVVLLVFQLFPAYSGVGDKLKNLVYKELHLSTIVYPNPQAPDETIMLTEYFDKVIGEFFKGASKGSVTIFSGVLVIWAALALLLTIEKAFNSIWHVPRERSFLHRIINYWAILTLGPLLLGSGVYITTRYSMLGQIQRTVMSSVTPEILHYLIATIGFFLLYFVLPNTRVWAKAAIWGAAVAALVWSFAKWGFAVYVTQFIPYNQLYGVLGLVPLGVFWIFISWLIVLFGLQVTFTTQNLKSLDEAEMAAARGREEYFIANDFTAVNIVVEVCRAFLGDRGPVSLEAVCSRFGLPGEFAEKLLGQLVRQGILVKTVEPVAGYVPATEAANLTLARITEAVRKAGFAQRPAELPENLQKVIRSQQEMLAQYNIGQILSAGRIAD